MSRVMTSHRLPAGVRAQAALSHLAGPLVALAVAAGVGRPVIWAGVAAPVGSAIAYLLIRHRSRFAAAHAGEALNGHLSIAVYLCAVAAMTLVAQRFAVAGPLLPVALLLVLLLGLNWLLFLGIAIVRAARGVEFDYPLALRFVRGRR